MKTILVVLFLQCCVFLIRAQYTIQGSILNSEQKEIPYANVQLFRIDSSFVNGCVADSMGMFLLKEIEKGSYFLYISSIIFYYWFFMF